MIEQNNHVIIEIDQGSIKDFFDEFNDIYDLVIGAIESLEKPQKYTPALLNSVFRGVHTIKSNLSLMGCSTLSNVVHQLENILDQIRQNQCAYVPEYGDIVRLALDEIKISAGKCFNHEPMTMEFDYITTVLKQISQNPETRPKYIEQALKLLDPFNKLKHLKTIVVPTPPATAAAPIKPAISNNSYQYVAEDLNFFEQISTLIGQRLCSPPEKIDLIKKVSLKMNVIAKFKVEQVQLQAAICLYNLGFGSLPICSFEKKDSPPEETREHIEKCLQLSVAFLHNLPFWQPAATIVAQCYDRLDKNTICDGAKILAITRCFATIFYAKPEQEINIKGMMAAVLEVNNAVGSKFDEYWVSIFNKAIKGLHQDHQLLY